MVTVKQRISILPMGVDDFMFMQNCLIASLADETPEGKSIVELAKERNVTAPSDFDIEKATLINFTAETRSSGINLPDGKQIRKGAFDAIKKIAIDAGNTFPKETEENVRTISSNGGTPLVVSENKKVIGVIELQDIIKPGIKERFERLRKMGVKTVMVTGDNPLDRKIYC